MNEIINKISEVLCSNKYKTSYWRFEKVIEPSPNLGLEELTIEDIQGVFEAVKEIYPTSNMNFLEVENFLNKKRIILDNLNDMFKKLNEIFRVKTRITERIDGIYKVRQLELLDLFEIYYGLEVIDKKICEEAVEQYIQQLKNKIADLENEIWYLKREEEVD